jgi:competence protein ComGC
MFVFYHRLTFRSVLEVLNKKSILVPSCVNLHADATDINIAANKKILCEQVQLLSAAEGGQKASKKRLSPDGAVKKGYTSSSASSSPSGCSQEEITPPIHLMVSTSLY